MGTIVKPGVLVISHGSRVSEWVSHVDDAVRTVQQENYAATDSWIGSENRDAGAAGTVEAKASDGAENGDVAGGSQPGAESGAGVGSVPVTAAFLELVEGRLIQDGIDQLEARGVTDMLVVPLFLSSGSKHVNEIGWALGAYKEPLVETELERFRVRVSLTYGHPIDADPEIVEVLLERSRGLLDGGDPAEATVLLIGHGSEHAGLHEAWARGLSALAEAVRERGGYADAEFAMLRPDMAADAVRRLRERRPGCELLALPVFLSEGYFTSDVVPRRLEGLGCRYDGRTLMPHSHISRWIARQIAEWLDSVRMGAGKQ